MKKKAFAGLLVNKGVLILSRKTILVILVILLSGFGESAFAQDLLMLKSGTEIKVNIVEEGPDIIKYREFENPTGPLYSVARDKVASVKYGKESKEIKQAIGRETDKPVAVIPSQVSQSGLLTAKKRFVYLDGVVQAPRSVRLLMEDQPEALRSYDSGMKMFRRSNACPLAGMVLSFATAYSIKDMPEQSDKIRVGVIVLSIEGVLVISGILFAKAGKTKLKNSASLYNSAINKPVSYKLDFGLQENGIGMALKF